MGAGGRWAAEPGGGDDSIPVTLRAARTASVTSTSNNRPICRFLASVSLVAFVVLTSSATGIGGVSRSQLGPDGLIVFSCFGCPGDREPGGLSTIRPNGSGLRELPGTEGDGEPSWSPDGRVLAVARADGIWLRAADGSHARRLTQRHPQGYDESPAWSPDGKQIVFDRGIPKGAGGGVRRGLWIVDARGGRPRPLLLSLGREGKPEWSIANPDWSPDGRRIAFSFGAERLMVVRVGGRRMQRLGPPMLRGRDPHWSPDGRSIAFFEFSEYRRPHRFRILNLTNGRLRTVFTSEGSVWAQSWSPDGRWLAIMATRQVACKEGDPSDECEALGLWIVNPTNARRTLIYTFGQEGGDVSGIDWRASR
jgi:dipeptidyl aminopeptidase/acylaminoacyl peptidase